MSNNSHSKGKECEIVQLLQNEVCEGSDLLCQFYRQNAFDLAREEAWNAQAYLEARGIPLDIALCAGVGYVAAEAAQHFHEHLRSWEERLLFPLLNAEGDMVGLTGRLIREWQSCCDVADHQKRLHASGQAPWIKVGLPGWFWNPQYLPPSDPVILVDGPFDRLAILATGHFDAGEVIALARTVVRPEWLSKVQSVLFAVRNAHVSKDTYRQLRQHLAWHRISVDACQLPSNRRNWSECWRREGVNGLEVLYSSHALLAHGL
jgi:hypothetical protein